MTPDGAELLFFKRVGPGDEDYRVFRSVRSGDAWSSPEVLDLGGNFSDLYPAVSPDGRMLAFSSYRPAPGDTNRQRNAHLWYAMREAGGWGTPKFMAASTLGHYHSGLRFVGDGALRFGRTTPDWRSSAEYMLRRSPGGEGFSSPELLPRHPAAEFFRQRAGDSLHVWGAVDVPDGSVLVQVSQLSRPPNRRTSPAHFFVSSRSGDAWTPLTPAGAGLGSGAPNFLWFSRDGCWAYYTRNYAALVRAPVRAVTARSSSTP